MKKQKLKYLGTARGQAESVLIGGLCFERGEIYELDAELAERLLVRGGFDVVKPAKSAKRDDAIVLEDKDYDAS